MILTIYITGVIVAFFIMLGYNKASKWKSDKFDATHYFASLLSWAMVGLFIGAIHARDK